MVSFREEADLPVRNLASLASSTPSPSHRGDIKQSRWSVLRKTVAEESVQKRPAPKRAQSIGDAAALLKEAHKRRPQGAHGRGSLQAALHAAPKRAEDLLADAEKEVEATRDLQEHDAAVIYVSETHGRPSNQIGRAESSFQRNDRDEQRAVQTMKELLLGLKHMHKMGFMHRQECRALGQ